jgi:ribosome-interacting GTPase 1
MPDNRKTRKAIERANAKLTQAKRKLKEAEKRGAGQTLAQFQVNEAKKDLREAIDEFDS